MNARELPLVPVDHVTGEPIIVDCDTCVVRSAAACGDCVVTALLGDTGPDDAEAPAVAGSYESVTFDPHEQRALDALVGSGLLPPLRLVVSVPSPIVDADGV